MTGSNEDYDTKLAMELVESVSLYYHAVNKEIFNFEEYRKAEYVLHQISLIYGERLDAIRRGEK